MSRKLHAVRTWAHLNCAPDAAWEKVCFYEHIELQPTWLLRTVLPVPMRTTGAYRKAGDISSCQYSDGGHLTKRIRLIGDRRVDFDVIAQTIRYAGRIDLKGGRIRINEHIDGSCSVEMITYYDLRAPWLRLLKPAINYVVRAMHRIVMRDMRYKLEPQYSQAAPRSGAEVSARSPSMPVAALESNGAPAASILPLSPSATV